MPLSLCGEMAGRPLEAMALIGLGFRRLSMSATAIGRVKTMIRGSDTQALANVIEPFLNSPDHTVRDKLRSFADKYNISV